jgi:hypothetical protein
MFVNLVDFDRTAVVQVRMFGLHLECLGSCDEPDTQRARDTINNTCTFHPFYLKTTSFNVLNAFKIWYIHKIGILYLIKYLNLKRHSIE